MVCTPADPQTHLFLLSSHMWVAQSQLLTATTTIHSSLHRRLHSHRMEVLGPGETYGAKNQDVKTDAEGFDQRPLFHVVLLIVLGISVRQKQPYL